MPSLRTLILSQLVDDPFPSSRDEMLVARHLLLRCSDSVEEKCVKDSWMSQWTVCTNLPDHLSLQSMWCLVRVSWCHLGVVFVNHGCGCPFQMGFNDASARYRATSFFSSPTTLSLAPQLALMAALGVLIESGLKCSWSTESFSMVYNVLTLCQQNWQIPPLNNLKWVIKEDKCISDKKRPTWMENSLYISRDLS